MRPEPPRATLTLAAECSITLLGYALDLDIDFDASTFRGNVRITDPPADRPLELDSVELSIESVSVGGRAVPYRLDATRDKLVIEIPPGESGPIDIRYGGTAGRGVQTGLFVSRLGDLKALSTQMEPEGCRRLLPCFDRPDRKAEFRLVVTAPDPMTVIANMPGASEVVAPGRRRWTFEPTPPMATYLLYLGVGPFEESRDESEAPTIIIAGPPGSRSLARRGLADARASLRSLAEYFGVAYPLPKLHLIALSDFWVAMENWGAIAGADSHYLIDGPMSPASLRFAEQTIVHEISHQWFGDLVTLAGWEDLWLNEAFATFVTGRIGELGHIRQDPWGEFVLFTARGDPVDSLRSTHPVRPDSVAAKEIMARADNITYFKGSRLIRMIESYLGEEPFRRGLSTYLARHRFGNARSTDLWRALEESSGRGVVGVMQTWVERAGHPVIDVREDGPDLVLVQRRFGYLPVTEPGGPWPIPLRIRSPKGEERILFDEVERRLPGRDFATTELDPGRTGFFRFLPAPALRPLARDRLLRLAPIDRWAYLHDARAFLLSGDFSLEDYLELVATVASATDLVTVEEVTQSLQILLPLLHDVPRFVATARQFAVAQSDRLGPDAAPGEPEWNGTMREWVAHLRVLVDADYGRALAARWPEIDSLSISLRPSIALAAARFGSPETVDQLCAQIHDPDAEVADRACSAALGLASPERVGQFLGEGLRSARLGDLFVPLLWGAARNPVGAGVTWTWLTEHLRELERRAQGSYLLAYSLDGILPALGVGREEEVRRYFAREKFPEGEVGIETGLETIEVVQRLRARIREPGPPTSAR